MRARTGAVIPTRTTELSEQAKVAKVARLLERAAKKQNESADATGSVTVCFEPSDRDFGHEEFSTIFDLVNELAEASMVQNPDYLRAARKLIAKLAQRTSRRVSRNKKGRK